MFGTSGIRGVYGKDITEELALKIGNAFGEGELYVGRDLRESGTCLKNAITAGAMSNGCDVTDLGIVPTPTVAFARKRGIMITASHNPAEYNGLKLMEDGKEIGKELQDKIVRMIAKEPGIERPGRYSRSSDVANRHMDMICDSVDVRKKPTIVIDCNGAAAAITPYVLGRLGCRVISVNSSLSCFNRESEPNEKNLSHLGRMVAGFGADFGIAHDGDGDRTVVFDDRGFMLPFDVQLAMMIEHEMESSSNKRIISTVESSLAIRDTVERLGGEIEITPVGSTFIGERMRETGALFGGEPCGEYIYGKGVHVPDGPMAAAKFVEIFEKGKFSELRKNYSHGHMVREKFRSNDKDSAMEKIRKEISIGGRIRDDDGIRIDEDDGWLLIRKSGTEPVIRLTMEYQSKEKMEKRKAELTGLIKRFIS